MQGHEARLAAFRELNASDYRSRAIDMVEDGDVDCRMMLGAALKYMSQDDVKDMLTCNELIDD